MANPLPPLTLLETRVLGTLVEKQHTVPDSYPLSLNALVSGCNQKSARHPVMEATDAEVQAAVDNLKGYNLVVETSGSRVTRYAHNVDRVLQIPSQSVAILAVLMLRGPQTAGELRIATERLHKFADISAVEAFLTELATRPAGALVLELPRQRGARENRWAHTLSGVPESESPAPEATEASAAGGASLQARVAQLEADVSELKDAVTRLAEQLNAR